MGFPHSSVGKASACNALPLDPWVGKILWRRKWQLTPVFLPREFHGQRSLEGYSPWRRKRVVNDLATNQQEQFDCYL